MRCWTLLIAFTVVACAAPPEDNRPPKRSPVAEKKRPNALQSADLSTETAEPAKPFRVPQKSLRAKPERDPKRFERIRPKRAVTHSLLDLLVGARIESSRIHADFVVMKPGKRNYANPWASGPLQQFNRRHVWTDGQTAQWALRSALTLPVPARCEWDLTIPANASMRFGIAVGTRVKLAERVTVSAGVITGGGKRILWTQTIEPTRIHKLKRWQEIEVDLRSVAGQKATLFVAAQTQAPGGYRYVAMFAEPVISALASDEPTRAAIAKRTTLDAADNVLLVIIDAQRADLLAPLRQARGLPAMFDTMESLVAGGTSFTQAFSVGNQTRLSTFALLSGQYPTTGGFHNARWNYPDAQKKAFYSHDPPLLPRLMRNLGYRVVGVANNLFVFGHMALSLDAGFDRFIDHRHGTKDTAWITESAKSWIRDHKDERWFMMLNYNAPHTPYQPPNKSYAPFKERVKDVTGYSKPYLGEIKWSDENLGQIISLLRELALERRTLVVITSDHGEVMDPRHQCYNHNWKSNCLHNHGKTLYDEELHVPLVFHLPGRVPAQSIDTAVSHVDLAPTILGLLGVQPPSKLRGRDLSDAILKRTRLEETPIVAEARLSTALRWKGHKYIVHNERERMVFELDTLYDRKKSLEELYDLSADPGELNNLAWDPNNPVLKVMQNELAKHKRQRVGRQTGDDLPSPVAVPGAVLASPGTSRVHNMVLFHWDQSRARITGTIATQGVFTEVDAIGPSATNRSIRDGNQAIRVDASFSDQRTGVRFSTDPPGAALKFMLKLDGKLLDSRQFYVGAYGLPLYSAPARVESLQHRRLARAPAKGPAVIPGIPTGVFYWRVGQRGDAAGSGNIESAGSIDSEVRALMKSWGYVAK